MDINKKFKNDADKIIGCYGFDRHDAVFTGSYILDLMVCPDLDLYFARSTDMYDLLKEFYRNEHTDEIYLMKGRMAKADPSLADADHIQIRTDFKTDDIKWKIDIWFLDPELIEKKMERMNVLKSRLDAGSAEAIIRIKDKLKKKNGFTPPYASYHIYDCYLNRNITGYDEICRYLAEQGIEL